MRRRWQGMVLGIGLAVAARPAAAAPPRAPAAILLDALSGESLREQYADTARPAAALNDLMVLLLAMEEASLGALPLDAPVTVSDAATGSTAQRDGAIQRVAAARNDGRHAAATVPPDRIPLRRDGHYVLGDLLKAMLIAAKSDAAVGAAEAISGSLPTCLELMNARAARLGMDATHYETIGGTVGAASADTTTARDLARLAQALVRYPQVLQWASLSGLPFDQGAVLLRNTNSLLDAVPGADGLQASASGMGTPVASFSVLATAQRGALRLIAAVLDAPDSATRYSTAAEWLEWGFQHYERLEIAKRGEPINIPIQVVNGSVSQLTPITGQTFSLLHRRDEERDLQVRYQLPTMLTAPLNRHEPIGEIIVEEKGALIGVIPVLSPSNVVTSGILSAALP